MIRSPAMGILAVAPALALAGCSALLGLDAKPIDDGNASRASTDGAHEGGGARPPGADGSGVNAPEGSVADDGGIADDGAGASDGYDGKIDCLGVRRDAFLCDGFESGIGTSWQTILLPSHPPATVKSSTRHVAGALGMSSAFSPLPSGTGAAKLRYLRPGGVGALSLQLSIYIAKDAWGPGDAVTIGGLRAAGAPAAELYFVASGNNGAGHIEVRVSGSTTIDLGAIAADQFRCFEVAWNGAVVTAYAGAANKGSAPLALPVDSAEVGMEYALGANPNAGKNMEYDDVVIAPAPIGCLH